MAEAASHPFAALLGREVEAVEIERSAMADLERVRAVVFAGGARFDVPPGNRMRSAGDLAEIRALLAGWPRDVAAALRGRWRGAPDAEALAAIETLLEDWARDPDLAQAPPATARSGSPDP